MRTRSRLSRSDGVARPGYHLDCDGDGRPRMLAKAARAPPPRDLTAILGQGMVGRRVPLDSTSLPSPRACLLLSLMFTRRCREPAPGVTGGRDMPSEARLETTWVPESKMEVAAPGTCVRPVGLISWAEMRKRRRIGSSSAGDCVWCLFSPHTLAFSSVYLVSSQVFP